MMKILKMKKRKMMKMRTRCPPPPVPSIPKPTKSQLVPRLKIVANLKIMSISQAGLARAGENVPVVK